MNFLAHTTSFVCSQVRLIALSLCECKSGFCSVLRRVYVGRIYSSIAKILKFDWSMQVTWKRRVIVNQISLSKRFLFEHIRLYNKRIWPILQLLSFLVPVGASGLFSRSRLLLYYFELLFRAICKSSSK